VAEFPAGVSRSVEITGASAIKSRLGCDPVEGSNTTNGVNALVSAANSKTLEDRNP
jgi:hypothetical protein